MQMEYPEGPAVHIEINYGANWRHSRLISTMPLWCGLGTQRPVEMNRNSSAA